MKQYWTWYVKRKSHLPVFSLQTYSHEVYFDRDLVLHIEQKPSRVFSCYVYQMVCDPGEEEETTDKRSKTDHNNFKFWDVTYETSSQTPQEPWPVLFFIICIVYSPVFSRKGLVLTSDNCDFFFKLWPYKVVRTSLYIKVFTITSQEA